MDPVSVELERKSIATSVWVAVRDHTPRKPAGVFIEIINGGCDSEADMSIAQALQFRAALDQAIEEAMRSEASYRINAPLTVPASERNDVRPCSVCGVAATRLICGRCETLTRQQREAANGTT